jgi:hypothetical protein
VVRAESVEPEPTPVFQIIVTARLALRPVAQIVLMHKAKWPGHAYQHTRIDHRILEPERALEAVVNEPAMHADRMPCAQRDGATNNKDGESVPREQQRPGDQRNERHRPNPDRLYRLPSDAAFDRISS